jgi:hypothetical protein
MSETAYFIPTRSIGDFEATVTISEDAYDDLEITQHPVQQGASITDHAFLKPAVVRIEAKSDDSDAPLSEVYSRLLKLQSDREPMAVITGKRSYKNMLVRTLHQITDAQTENLLSFSVEMQEIIIVSVEVATVPARQAQQAPEKTGKTETTGAKKAAPVGSSSSTISAPTSTSGAGAAKKQSALKSLLG